MMGELVLVLGYLFWVLARTYLEESERVGDGVTCDCAFIATSLFKISPF